MNSRIPDLLSIVAEGDPKRLVCYCLNDLGPSIGETEKLVRAALHIASSMDWLLRGGDYIPATERHDS